MENPKVSIIVPVYSATPELLEMAKTCINEMIRLSSNAEVIVIDDASPCEFDFSTLGAVYFRRKENKGIYANWDLGIDMSTGDYICIVNSDIKPHDGWLSGLLEAEQKFGGFVFPTPIDQPHDAERRVYQTYSHGLTYAPCFLFSRELIKSIPTDGGFFDVGYTLWFGDSDMWNRAKKLEINLTTTSKAFVYHTGGGHQTVNMVPKKEEIFNNDKNLFKRRWG